MVLVRNSRIGLVVAILAGGFAVDGWSAETSQVKLLQMLPNTSEDPGDRAHSDLPLPNGNPGDPSIVVAVGMNTELPNPVEYYAINMIEVDEEGGENNPCFLRLWGNMVDPRYSKDANKRRLLAKYELPTCGSVIPSLDLETAGFQPSQSRFIRGLRLCIHAHHRSEFELKGVGVVAGEVTSGSVTVQPRDPEGRGFKRANCPDHPAGDFVGNASGNAISGWTAWVDCSDATRELMTGVTVYVHGKYISGLMPVCLAVTAEWGPAPVKDDQGY